MIRQTLEYPFDYYYVSGVVTAQALTYNIALVKILTFIYKQLYFMTYNARTSR